MGRSKAQDKLEAKLRELYPEAFISSEDYIGDVIEERGYSVDEIRKELGHKPHKMFVDVMMRDSDRTVSFEYHGEQHYSLVGNMTKTSADLLINQQLDQEKSWILSRVGIPIVAIPFDMYIDERVIEELIDEATQECMSHRAELIECSGCQRLFPASEMPYGICRRCMDEPDCSEDDMEEPDDESIVRRKKKSKSHKDEDARNEAKRLRKERYQKYKNSPEYKARKEEAKRLRKERYQQMKAERDKRKGQLD